MMPDNVLSTDPTAAGFLPPRNLQLLPLNDYELGGIALNDASQGLQVQTWHGFMDGDDFKLEATSVPAFTLLTIPDVVDIRFTFDQLMRPFVAYTLADDSSHFYWYDSVTSDFVTTTMDAGCTNLRCSLDDKRRNQGTISDIILAYLRDGSLQMRVQRDRYQIEYTLAAVDPGVELLQIGMNRAQRFQYKLYGSGDEPPPVTNFNSGVDGSFTGFVYGYIGNHTIDVATDLSYPGLLIYSLYQYSGTTFGFAVYDDLGGTPPLSVFDSISFTDTNGTPRVFTRAGSLDPSGSLFLFSGKTGRQWEWSGSYGGPGGMLAGGESYLITVS